MPDANVQKELRPKLAQVRDQKHARLGKNSFASATTSTPAG